MRGVRAAYERALTGYVQRSRTFALGTARGVIPGSRFELWAQAQAMRLLGAARWPARYLVRHPGVIDELAALKGGPHERIARGDGVLYWQVPKTGTLDSTIGKTMGKKRYKSSTTTRNLRTLAKVLRG